MGSEEKKSKKWFPLESNPQIMNEFCRNLGLPTNKYQFCDVFGLDDDLLMMVPQPVQAVLMLFPITPKSEENKGKEEERIKAEGQTVSSNVYYMKQTIGNACGTIGLMHSVLNSIPVAEYNDGFLKTFYEKTAKMTPEERAKELEADDEIDATHSAMAQEGQSAVPETEESVDLHFVALVERDGHLYELDGRKSGPINHGPSSPETLLKDAAQVVKKFMAADPENLMFNIIALAAPSDF